MLICQLVNFIYYQNYRCFYLLQQVQDIILACTAFFGCIYYEEDNVNLLQGAFSRAYHVFAQLVLRLMDARRIKKHNLCVISIHNAHNLIACSLRSVGHNSDFFAYQTVCQSGLAHIRTSHHCHKAGIMFSFFVVYLLYLNQLLLS